MDRRRIGGTEWQVTSGPAAVETQTIELASRPTTRKKRTRSKATRWRKILLPLTVAIAVLLGGLVGRTVSETSSTLDKIQSVSTPPPQVADATVRDSGVPTTVEAEQTDPPRESSEDPGGSSSTSGTDNLQELPAPDNTQTSGQEGSEGNPTSVETAGPSTQPTTQDSAPSSSTQEPLPTPTPDGEALAEQMLEEGMTFDTAPAVAAMAQYQQQAASAGLPNGSATESAEPAEGEGSPSGSADTESVSSTEGNADNDGGVFGTLEDVGGHLRDAAGGAAIAAGVSNPDLQPLTILVMGVDARPGSAIDIGVRPDALMVLRLDPVAGTCKGLAIPRDSYVELPGYGKTKINHALMLGGIPYEQLVIEQYLGIDIDHYALIDFTGFAELVDSVGGITIDVPPDLASPAVAAGQQTITGDEALLHARYRGGPDGDFGRIKRQQQIMRGLIAAAGGRDLLSEATRLLNSLQDHIRTDMDIEQLVGLANTYQDQCDVDGLHMNQIPGEVVYGPLIDPLFNLPLSYVVSDPEDVAAAVDALFSDD